MKTIKVAVKRSFYFQVERFPSDEDVICSRLIARAISSGGVPANYVNAKQLLQRDTVMRWWAETTDTVTLVSRNV